MYTVEQLVERLKLHPKTVRRFIREGKLKARKIGRAWRVSEADLQAFLQGEGVEPPPPRSLAERVHVSAVIELAEGHADEIARISNSLIAVLNSKDPTWGAARYDLLHHPEDNRARFVLNGSPRFVRTVLELVDVLLEQDP